MKLSTNEDKPFNATIAMLERLDRRFEDAHIGKIEGNLMKYYRSLESAWMIMKPRVPKDSESNKKNQKGEILTEAELARAMIEFAKSGLRSMTKGLQFNSGLLSDAEDNIDDAFEYINELAFKYKLTWWETEAVPYDEEVSKDFS